MRHAFRWVGSLMFSTLLLVTAAVAGSPAAPPDISRDYAGRPVGNMTVAPSPLGTNREVQDLRDIHFEFDRAELRAEDRQILAADADWLKAHPAVNVTIEGDADDRGDIVYNVTLSDQRALVTRDALVSLGVPAERIVFSTGWGKLYPVCGQADESCWSENRRAHFARW
jgi:outer membrane protein OmpA-like peptidoglycan-associated protein